jgi:hypothetical protein
MFGEAPMAFDVRAILEQHARLKQGWQQPLKMLETGRLTTRSKGAGGAWRDTTRETVHFIRTQISILDALDRLMATTSS